MRVARGNRHRGGALGALMLLCHDLSVRPRFGEVQPPLFGSVLVGIASGLLTSAVMQPLGLTTARNPLACPEREGPGNPFKEAISHPDFRGA